MNRLNQHLQAFKLVLSRMDSNKLSTFMISLVIAVAMAIPGLFYLGVEHLSKLSNHMQNETEISLFVKRPKTPKPHYSKQTRICDN